MMDLPVALEISTPASPKPPASRLASMREPRRPQSLFFKPSYTQSAFYSQIANMADLNTLEVPINYQSLAILAIYLSTAAILALTCCNIIYFRYQARKKNNDWATPQRRTQFFLFALLAVLSLSFTWYHMFMVFIHSYTNWATSPEGMAYSNVEMPFIVRMGLWLKNTYLFQEAWETVSETSIRFWWSGQIFGWTIGWSVFLGITGRRYRIPHVWVYMLLAQFVAVSFASNLFFATILVSQRPNKKDVTFTWSPPLIFELLPVTLSLLDTVAVPIFAHKKEFMPLLLAPHLLVFVPCLLGPSVSSKATKAQGDQTTRRYVVFIQSIGAAFVVLQAYFTALMLQDIGSDVSYVEVARLLLDAIYAHPACSSVSWDVIFCTSSASIWALVHGFDASQMLGGQ
ncbi:hypothetical protein N7457_007012 [Penicillium paradoxum]|uniref:uncharacterized protein n=1 Tax=Penicillium paradoxum TaxID=176176 RepID=UPI0025466643|nr:uncharacterized protein N7457_007012 [Penicillium paradoxum]KAJ5779292.1 hypothetical protein N7457_007012 [Penicillium paradoxum]